MDYMIDEGELVACLDSDVFTFKQKKTDPDFNAKLLKIMFETEKMLNFADYMFLRRVNTAWEKCAVEQLIS